MKVKQIVTLSVAAVGALGMSSTFAATTQDASACMSEALHDANFILGQVAEGYANGHSTATIDAVTTQYNAFVKGSGPSSAKSGLVYSKFGVQSGGPQNYIFVAYMGKDCGPASNTKLLCNLKVAKTDNTFANFTSGMNLTDVRRNGFGMDCKVCSGVHLDASGDEATAPAATGFSSSDLFGVSTALSSSLGTSETRGMVLASSTTAWASATPGPAACNEVPQ